jgi:hypothetical protein
MSDMKLEHKIFYCHAVAQLLLSDVVLTDMEVKFLEGLMDRLGLDEPVRRAIMDEVNLEDPVDERLRELPLADRKLLLEELRAAATVDGNFAIREAALISQMRKVLLLGEGDQA